MPELDVPEGTMADKNRGTEIILDGEENVQKGTEIRFENLDGIELEVDGFYEVESDIAEPWVHLHAGDSPDSGIFGIDILWREVAERVKYGDAEVLE